MEILIYIVLAFFLGYWISTNLMIRRILKDPDSMIQMLQRYKEAKEDVEIESTSEISLNIERVGGAYYAYAENNKFLAQGNDFRSLLEQIKKSNPSKILRVNKYQPNLTEDEIGQLIKNVFEDFKDDSSKKN
jgi:hypothetical protein